ncbi:DNA adenine methylase [Gammaproteobacteria bacterium]|nr:DNA adenine methylase [Gammaproteobacteria bacterium]
MTSYHGGKQRIGERIAKTIVNESMQIEDDYDFKIKGYCEPFCGMMGVYRHIPRLFQKEGLDKLKYKAGDLNESVIKMWLSSKGKWKPSSDITSRKQFMSLKGNGRSSSKKGFIGHMYGYGGQYFRPFRDGVSKNRLKRSIENIKAISDETSNVSFSHGKYTQFSRLKNHIIYCDPPYRIQSQYYDERDNRLCFDTDEFIQWCIKMSAHNIVFVSEYKMPKEFDKIFSVKAKTLRADRIDNLYIIY